MSGGQMSNGAIIRGGKCPDIVNINEFCLFNIKRDAFAAKIKNSITSIPGSSL